MPKLIILFLLIIIFIIFMKKIREVLANMKVNEERTFEPEKYRSVAVACSEYGFITGRKYRVRRNCEQRLVIVRREE